MQEKKRVLPTSLGNEYFYFTSTIHKCGCLTRYLLWILFTFSSYKTKAKKINKNKAVSIEHLLGLKLKKYVPWPESPCSYAI